MHAKLNVESCACACALYRCVIASEESKLASKVAVLPSLFCHVAVESVTIHLAAELDISPVSSPLACTLVVHTQR